MLIMSKKKLGGTGIIHTVPRLASCLLNYERIKTETDNTCNKQWHHRNDEPSSLAFLIFFLFFYTVSPIHLFSLSRFLIRVFSPYMIISKFCVSVAFTNPQSTLISHFYLLAIMRNRHKLCFVFHDSFHGCMHVHV